MGRLVREIWCRLFHEGEYTESDITTEYHDGHATRIVREVTVVRKCAICGRDKLGWGS